MTENGFNPTWDTENEVTFEVKVPQLAFLEVRVKDHSLKGKDLHVGSFCCALKNVNEGTMPYLHRYLNLTMPPLH